MFGKDNRGITENRATNPTSFFSLNKAT
eukprot:IDg17161t1